MQVSYSYHIRTDVLCAFIFGLFMRIFEGMVSNGYLVYMYIIVLLFCQIVYVIV